MRAIRRGQIAARDYDEFVEAVYRQRGAKRVPLFGSLTLTYRCNLRCRHCYAVPEQNTSEADTDTVRGWLDQIADAGCLWLLITGGEPLVRDDFSEIYLHAKRRGFIITVFSNGTLISPRIADLWREYPPYLVEISVYGATDGTSDRVTGGRGSLQDCLRGIRLLQVRGVSLRLKTTLTRANREELAPLRALAQSRGLDFRFDALLWPRLDKDVSPYACRLSPEELVRLDVADERRCRGWQEFGEKFGRPSHSDMLFSCAAGQTAFDIDPYGMLRPCDMARQVGYNLCAGTFAQGWQDYFPRLQQRKKQSRAEDCRNCLVSAWCDACPAWTWLEQGTDEARIEYLCEVARGRAAQFGRQETHSAARNSAVPDAAMPAHTGR